HECNVVHGNINPVTLRLTADFEIVKIADLGVVERSEGVYFGVSNSAFEPPELKSLKPPKRFRLFSRVGNGKLTPASDIYSLAQTTYTLLTGQSPGKYSQKQIRALPKHLSGQPWSSSVLRILRRATEVRPQRRYQKVNDFWNDFLSAVPFSVGSAVRSNKSEEGMTSAVDEQTQADSVEEQGREFLARHSYFDAARSFSQAITLAPSRKDRLMEEFGFILPLADKLSPQVALPESDQARLRWQTNVWAVLSERNHFPLPQLQDRPAKAVE